MEIFNRLSPDMKPLRRADTTPYLLVNPNKGVYFTALMTRKLKIMPDTYFHFVNEETDWFLYSDSNEAGFPVKTVPKQGGYWIYSKMLAKKILETTGFKTEKRFTIEKTEVELDGRELLKLVNKNIPTYLK